MDVVYEQNNTSVANMKFLLVFVGLIAAAFADEFEEARLALQNPDLYDGDMMGIDGPFDAERNARYGDFYRWPNAVVPYVIDASLENQKGVIEKGFKNYHDNTCVRFVPRTNENNYIKIFSGKGCYSNVGKIEGQQPVSLGPGCHYVGTVVHELGHALGFYHEQSRSDRDDFLQINLENVKPGRELNFAKLKPSQNILYNTFDYKSIMIYGNKSFSKNGKDTMVAKTGEKLSDPYNKQGMTASDIERVRKMYKC